MKENIGYIFLILLDLAFLCAGILAIKSFIQNKKKYDNALKNWNKINAVISEIENKDKPGTSDGPENNTVKNAYIDYSYEEKEYKHVRLMTYDESFKEGKAMEIFVNPSEPSNFVTLYDKKVSGIMAVAFPAIFVLMCVVTVFLIIFK